MTPPAEEQRALTLGDAAEALGVTTQRVSQLLKDGVLEGPTFDDERAPKGAGRVWPNSLAEAQANPRRRPRAKPDAKTAAGPADDDLAARLAALEAQMASLTNRSSDSVQSLLSRERSVRDVALQLKAAYESRTEELQAERQMRIEAEAEASSLRARVEALEAQVRSAGSDRDLFSDALTQLLGPGDVGELISPS